MRRNPLSIAALVVPALLVVALTTTYPLISAFFTSFRFWRLTTSPEPGEWVGFENYLRAFGDGDFLNSIIVTLIYSLISVAFSLGLGLTFALLLQRENRFNTAIRVLLIFPYAVSPALKGFSWRFMLNPNYGVYDWIMGTLFPFWSGVIWLAEPGWALFWMAMSEVWGWAPLIALMFIGALGSIPEGIYEAARIDGASKLQLFRSITLPLLLPVILIVALLKTIFSLKLFAQVVTMTGGGPGRATQTLNYYVYQNAFRNLDMGYASALAWILVFVMSVFAFFYVYLVLQRQN